jgi:hypothetical protein
MSSTKQKLRLIGAFGALATLGLLASCRGFFVNPTVTSLAIGPANLSLAPATSFQMSATATYSDGSTSDATGKAVWVSTDENVATFPSPGNLTAVSLTELEAQGTFPGTTSVSASIGTVTSASQTVNVCPVVQTLAITVNGSSSSASVPGGGTATFQRSLGHAECERLRDLEHLQYQRHSLDNWQRQRLQCHRHRNRGQQRERNVDQRLSFAL